MPLSEEQIKNLLRLVATCDSDPMDCDGCLQKISEFAEMNLVNTKVPDALQAVQRHLEQCPCCRDEFTALKEALSEIDGN